MQQEQSYAVQTPAPTLPQCVWLGDTVNFSSVSSAFCSSLEGPQPLSDREGQPRRTLLRMDFSTGGGMMA